MSEVKKPKPKYGVGKEKPKPKTNLYNMDRGLEPPEKKATKLETRLKQDYEDLTRTDADLFDWTGDSSGDKTLGLSDEICSDGRLDSLLKGKGVPFFGAWATRAKGALSKTGARSAVPTSMGTVEGQIVAK